TSRRDGAHDRQRSLRCRAWLTRAGPKRGRGRHAGLQVHRQPAADLCANVLMGQKLSEYHTGYRGFTREVLEKLPLAENSDDFVFDNQMLCQAIAGGFRIGEVSCPTRYFAEASSINFRRSVVYGFGVLGTAARFRLHKAGLRKDRLFDPAGAKLMSPRA